VCSVAVRWFRGESDERCVYYYKIKLVNDISRLLLFTPPNHPPTTAATHTLFVERRLIITPSNPSGDDGEPFAATNKIIYNNYNAAGDEEPIDYIGTPQTRAPQPMNGTRTTVDRKPFYQFPIKTPVQCAQYYRYVILYYYVYYVFWWLFDNIINYYYATYILIQRLRRKLPLLRLRKSNIILLLEYRL